jgi:hypothetical protein
LQKKLGEFFSCFKISYYVDGKDYIAYELEEGARITPEPVPTKEGYTFSGWSDIPETMPAHDITIYGSYTTGVGAITLQEDAVMYLSVDGKRHTGLQKGLNIVRMRDGTTKKVVVK